jgi:F-type H+-transporting ATPase subunit gamma
MASTRELRRRVRSISATAQITRAMQMVAASKMRKAQDAATSVRPFVRLLYRIQRLASVHAVNFQHPLLDVRPVTKRAIILVASDKGLCGALNSNVFRLANRFDPATTVFIAAGRKAAQFVARTRRTLVAEFPYGDTPRYAETRAIAAMAREIFLKGDVDEIRIVATRFVNTLTQQPVTFEFLPVGEIKGLSIPGAGIDEAALAADTSEFLFEPGQEAILGYLLPLYLNVLLHVVLLNAKASEQSARMVSMKSATDNAEAMIQELTLTYNKLRQGHITQELLEIQGGQTP